MPRHITLVFPGQGSQSLGMLNSFEGDELNSINKLTNSVLGIDIIDSVKNGPEDILNKTSITQPALLITSYLYYKNLVDDYNLVPDLFAGHSLGEYSALVASNSIKLEEALALVHKRGICMENSQKGSMYAILNLSPNLIEEICLKVNEETGEVVSPANINSPNQIVIAGSDKASQLVAERCKAAGAKRCIRLNVSIASHCDLMCEAANIFKKDLDACTFNLPEIPVVHNVDAKIEQNPINIKCKLLDQLTMPVQWIKTMEFVKTFNGIVIECGPGKVLSGLAKSNGLDNILSMSSESFNDDLIKLL